MGQSQSFSHEDGGSGGSGGGAHNHGSNNNNNNNNQQSGSSNAVGGSRSSRSQQQGGRRVRNDSDNNLSFSMSGDHSSSSSHNQQQHPHQQHQQQQQQQHHGFYLPHPTNHPHTHASESNTNNTEGTTTNGRPRRSPPASFPAVGINPTVTHHSSNADYYGTSGGITSSGNGDHHDSSATTTTTTTHPNATSIPSRRNLGPFRAMSHRNTFNSSNNSNNNSTGQSSSNSTSNPPPPHPHRNAPTANATATAKISPKAHKKAATTDDVEVVTQRSSTMSRLREAVSFRMSKSNQNNNSSSNNNSNSNSNNNKQSPRHATHKTESGTNQQQASQDTTSGELEADAGVVRRESSVAGRTTATTTSRHRGEEIRKPNNDDSLQDPPLPPRPVYRPPRSSSAAVRNNHNHNNNNTSAGFMIPMGTATSLMPMHDMHTGILPLSPIPPPTANLSPLASTSPALASTAAVASTVGSDGKHRSNATKQQQQAKNGTGGRGMVQRQYSNDSSSSFRHGGAGPASGSGGISRTSSSDGFEDFDSGFLSVATELMDNRRSDSTHHPPVAAAAVAGAADAVAVAYPDDHPDLVSMDEFDVMSLTTRSTTDSSTMLDRVLVPPARTSTTNIRLSSQSNRPILRTFPSSDSADSSGPNPQQQQTPPVDHATNLSIVPDTSSSPLSYSQMLRYLPPEMRATFLGQQQQQLMSPERGVVRYGSYGSTTGAGIGGTSVDPSSPEQSRSVLYYRRSSAGSMESNVSDIDDDEFNGDFYPPVSRDYEWMGRSIESLLLGHTSRAPLLALLDDFLDSTGGEDEYYPNRRRSTVSTFGGGPAEYSRRRSSQGSFPGGRRGSLSLSGPNMHGGTLANYYSRRRHTPTDVDRTGAGGRRGSLTGTTAPMYRQRRGSTATTGYPAESGTTNVNPSSSAVNTSDGRTSSNNSRDGNINNSTSTSNNANTKSSGPNVLLSIMARESTGKSCFARGIPASQCLRKMGGNALYNALDKPAAGMATEVAFLAASIDGGDWTETQAIVTRLAPRLIGDPMATMTNGTRAGIEDASLPPQAPKFYAGGGRLGLERDAFVLAGGVEVLIRMFREKSFVGQEMAASCDARDLSEEIVVTRLAACWTDALASLRELAYAIPSLVEDGIVSDKDFLPFLFTLLSHDSCFDGAAALIEEILSLLSQSPQQQASFHNDGETPDNGPTYSLNIRSSPATTFFLGNVPDLYKLWGGFNCRQLAHFCRILALLVFEPEDRQLLESPAVLKSLELLQLRRNRAVRAGRDSTVDMNQAILLGDEELICRLLKLLRVMNYAPSLRRFAPYHVMAHYPFIGETLIMLGLGELDDWDEVDRQDALARVLLTEDANNSLDGQSEPPLLSELGSVAEMLESLAGTLLGNSREPANQLTHIIHVISAAQQAGVVVGRGRRGRRRNQNTSGQQQHRGLNDNQEDVAGATTSVALDGAAIQGLASAAGILSDQVLVRRLYQNAGQETEDAAPSGASMPILHHDRRVGEHHLINTPEDSANSLQFNAMLLGPYQVEVLFVLCTLLGGRRKLDAQNLLNRLGLVPVLEDMFQRLPWHKRQSPMNSSQTSDLGDGSQPNGIHGPGCECTPESALCVQYLRLLHNFCDRDCDNYSGRRLLLSESERRVIFGGDSSGPSEIVKPGLLSKIIVAFINETDESPYRFWLASCIESYLRGSSPSEQLFAARSGLLNHLIEDISSERLHCAGSLQTSFDLLGELGKGNADVVRLLVDDLDEESFRKLMSVAAANLVDSNVFIRSLLLSLERLSASQRFSPLYLDPSFSSLSQPVWVSQSGIGSRSYLTHSWWDTRPISLLPERGAQSVDDDINDEQRKADWFPTLNIVDSEDVVDEEARILPTGLTESVGHFGWLFSPAGDSLAADTYLPNTLERLSWFLAANQARLLRDLLGVVDLRNINHENICCLNTAVVITIFAHRRQQLATLLQELRAMNDEEKDAKRRALDAAKQDDVVDRAFVQAMRYLDLSHQRDTPSYARRASLTHSSGGGGGTQQIGDRMDVMRNFREVLWFWMEYYTHRGRDRLSLEFSSHLRFQEWNHVVSLLAADDGSPTSLVPNPVRLPRSPYQRAARVTENPLRGV